jgi:hypothetical protein
MMNSALRALVRERAGRRCEYCRLHEDDADFLTFHVEHVVAKQHGGTDDPSGEPPVGQSAVVRRVPLAGLAPIVAIACGVSTRHTPRPDCRTLWGP